jgi:hypothetical protein
MDTKPCPELGNTKCGCVTCKYHLDFKDHKKECDDPLCQKTNHKPWLNWIERMDKQVKELGYDNIGHLYGV